MLVSPSASVRSIGLLLVVGLGGMNCPPAAAQ